MKKIISKILFLSYAAYLFVSHSYCTKNENDDSTLDLIKLQKVEAVEFLSAKYNAVPFNRKLINNIVNKTVVIDTNVIDLFKKGKDYFLKAEIISDTIEKCYAELICNDEIIHKFNLTKTNSLILVAEIKSISELNYDISADSLNGKDSLLGNEKIFLLRGNCLALIENELSNYAN